MQLLSIFEFEKIYKPIMLCLYSKYLWTSCRSSSHNVMLFLQLLLPFSTGMCTSLCYVKPFMRIRMQLILHGQSQVFMAPSVSSLFGCLFSNRDCVCHWHGPAQFSLLVTFCVWTIMSPEDIVMSTSLIFFIAITIATYL